MPALALVCLAATAASLLTAPALGTSFDRVRRTRRIVAQYQQPQPPQEAGTPQLPPGWEVYQDEQGQVYYGNVQTGQNQWEPPTPQYGEPQQPQQPQQPYGAQYEQQQYERYQQPPPYQQSPQYQQPQYQQPQEPYDGMSEADREVVAYVSERLQVPATTRWHWCIATCTATTTSWLLVPYYRIGLLLHGYC